MLSVDQTGVVEIAELPRPDVALDILDKWIELAEENEALFREQTIVEAERGDCEAALYADSAAAFSRVIADRLMQAQASIVALIGVLLAAKFFHIRRIADLFAIAVDRLT